MPRYRVTVELDALTANEALKVVRSRSEDGRYWTEKRVEPVEEPRDPSA